MQSHKWQNDLFLSKANHSISQKSKSMPQSIMLKKLSWMVPWRPARPSRTNTRKRCPFHYRGMECKSRKSRYTWSNREIWPWSTNEAGQRLTEFFQENALVIANTLYMWTSPDGQYQNQTDYILCSQNGEAPNSQQKQDWELTAAQIMNPLLPNSNLNWRK